MASTIVSHYDERRGCLVQSRSENVGDEHHQDEQWQNRPILLDVDDSGQAQFSWEITSDRGLTMGGWTIDNVCVWCLRL